MKRIISLSYYSDFSRFFCMVNDHIQKNSHSESRWVDFSIYPSSYLFNLIHGRECYFLPFEIKKKFSDIVISTEDLTWLCEYHTKDNVELIAEKYVSYFLDYFERNQVDLVIISGDSRLPARALSYSAKKHGIKILYFEQGPLNTTILDRNGVNANCSFRLNSNTSDDDTAFLKSKRDKVKKWNGYKKYRVCDVIYQSFFNDPILGKYELDGRKNKNKSQNKLEIENYSDLNYIVLILQVPQDANMILHSPNFSNHFEIVKNVYEALPKGYKLIVREHPLYKGRYEEELYNYISSHKIILENSIQLNKLICDSKLVIVNNSTVGLEAMTMNKSILVLGDSYYDNISFVNKYDGNNLEKSIYYSLNTENKLMRERINYLFSRCFLSGHFRDLESSRFLTISKFIENEIH